MILFVLFIYNNILNTVHLKKNNYHGEKIHKWEMVFFCPMGFQKNALFSIEFYWLLYVKYIDIFTMVVVEFVLLFIK